MTLPPPPDRWTIELANAERVEAIAAFAFTERQTRFLLQVLLHSGVFLERQYCQFAGTVHGQKSTDFIRALVDRRLATAITTGKLHRGRMFHVHYKPLWAAIGEPDSRFRKPTAQGRMIERVMLLDAVLDDASCTWLGPGWDKRRHFVRHLENRLDQREYPHLTFGDGPDKTVRYFPDKLPIGVLPTLDSHVFVYLVTDPKPMDFRLFLLRHIPLLRVLFRWTIRLLIPRRLWKARLRYLHAAREHLADRLEPANVEALEWLFPERKRLAETAGARGDDRYLTTSKGFGAPRLRALYRQWLEDPANTLWIAGSNVLSDAVEREHGRVECIELSRQYLHLSPLVNVRDGTFDERGLDPPPDNSPMTFGKFAEVYKQRHVLARGLALSSTIDYRLKPLVERFGDRPIAEIKAADIDDFVADLKRPRVVNGLEGRRLTPASVNRTLGLLRHMLNWAVGREYLDRTPFRRGTEVLIRMELEDNKRRRRVSESEEAALLAVASPHLRSMIIAALDTGMRRGEMLALRFGDIDWTRRMITLRGATTKSRRTRLVPIGTARLLAVLGWLRLDSEGEHKGDDVPVFSNEAGEALKTFKKAWVVAVLKAHGVDPRWRKGAYKDLSTECQQRFRGIDLHWHDLRHEYASRLVERGVPLAQVRDLLGHASILTTERYDNQRLEALQAAVERLEGGKTFDPEIDASDKVSRIFQDPTEQSFAPSEDPAKESATSH